MRRKSSDVIATSKKRALQVVEATELLNRSEVNAAIAGEAYDMRQRGYTWFQIGKTLEISSSKAMQLVNNRLKQAAKYIDEASKEELLAQELDRLDALQAAVWPRAMEGTTQSVTAALAIIAMRVKLLNLETVAAAAVTNNTVVVAGTSAEYIAALRSVADGTARAAIESS